MADALPEHCPSDPFEQQDFLLVQALITLVCHPGVGTGRPEVSVVVDLTETRRAGTPIVDWGQPVEVPLAVLHELAADADVAGVFVANGVVWHAPGALDLGRTCRVANRAQRRALRGLYSTCAIPGCAVRSDRRKLHHVAWWEHGGATDLANLLPVCEGHHHCIHDQSWTIELGHRRELTVTMPDGEVMSTGPPRRSAASAPGDRAADTGTECRASQRRPPTMRHPVLIDVTRLPAADVALIAAIDRSEHVDVEYAVIDGRLTERAVTMTEVPSWDPEGSGGHSVRAQIDFCASVIANGGVLLGAFDGAQPIGVAIVDPSFEPRMAWLAFLHVDRQHRRRGVASALWNAAVDIARAAGARSIYVSATPTGSAVGFYLHQGCHLADPPHRELFAHEPEDIHLVRSPL